MNHPNLPQSTEKYQHDMPASMLSGLIDIMQVVFKRKNLIALMTFAGTALVAGYSCILPNVYTATVKVVPTSQDKGMMSAMLSQLGGLANLVGGTVGGPTKTDFYVTILRTETINDQIIDRFHLMEESKTVNRSDLYMSLNRAVDVSAGKKDGVISISVSDKNPKRAADVANAYVEELSKLTANLSMENAGEDRIFLEERLNAVKSDLARSESALKSFQESNSAISVPDQAKVTIEGIAQLRGQLAGLEVELATFKSRLTDASQEVISTKASIANLRNQIAKLEGKSGKSSSLPVGTVPRLAQEYVRLMREFKIQETLLEVYTKQYEMAKLTEAKKTSTIQVIQSARVPDAKSGPKRRKMVELAAVFSFSISIFLAFLLENIAQIKPEDMNRLKQLFQSKVFKR